MKAIAPPDRTKAEAAIRELLSAIGVDPADPALADTPQRAAEAFLDVLAHGYQTDPAEALGTGFPVSSDDPVIATDLPAMFLCPHHLLPANARVHVAFVPRGKVPGLSRIARLIDSLGHRLVLQEDLGRWIVDALHAHLDVASALVIVEAQHLCVAVEDFARRDTRFTTRASIGDAEAIALLDQQIGASRAPRSDAAQSEAP